jgi:hypothetical protein
MSGMGNTLSPIMTVLGAAAGTMLMPGVGTMAGASLGGMAGSLLAGPPKMPSVPSPIAMPDQQMIEQQKQKSIAEAMQRRGRASTILNTPDQQKLG